MRKVFITTVLFLVVGTSYASVPSVQTDISNIKGAVPAGTPSVGGSYEQKGFVGHLLGEIFELSGHIQNQFIVAFQDIQLNFSNTVPKWDGQKFVEGSISDRNGNIGIGTSSPGAKLDVRGIIRQDTVSSTYDVWIQGGASVNGDDRNLALLGVDEDSGDRLILNYGGEYAGGTQIGGGNLGIATNNIPSRLTVEGGGDIASAGDQTASVLIRQTNHRLAIDANEMQSSFNGAATNFAINPHGGSVGVGGFPNASFTLDVKGSVGAVEFLYSSDKRLKKNFSNYVDGEKVLSKISVQRYDWKDGKKGSDVGVIAQEVQEVFPEAVNEGKDGYLSVNYPKLVLPVIEIVQRIQKTLQEILEKIDSLERENLELKEQNKEVLERINRIEIMLHK